MKIFTIGFTKKTARTFFTKLRQSGAKRIVDIRLNNVSQLAGFTKKDDLEFFLKEICGMDYTHVTELAPTQDIMDEFKKNKGDWSTFEKQFIDLMTARQVEKTVSREIIDNGCLLCSEDKPDNCHRRLVAEYLKKHWQDIEIIHIV